MLRQKKVKVIRATSAPLLAEMINEFFEEEGMCWRLISVLVSTTVHEAWLEYDPTN